MSMLPITKKFLVIILEIAGMNAPEVTEASHIPWITAA
jgi:hypothetical protein